MSANKKIWVLAALLSGWSSVSMASTDGISGKISRLLADSTRYGQCMIDIGYVPTNADCSDRWVSLDCSGSFYKKEVSRRLWDSAQLAYATDSTVFVIVDDRQKHNGFCVAARLDVIK